MNWQNKKVFEFYPQKRRSNEEYELCKSVSTFLKVQYPDLIFHFDYAAGIKLSIGSAKKLKALNRKSYPDLFIAEPRNGFAGLFIEVKTEKANPFLKNGNISKNKHIQEQYKVLLELERKGYLAEFGVGFEGCKKIIKNYLNL